MIKGGRYIPIPGVQILEKRTNITLDKNEGVYVQNVKTGQVKLVSGTSYMLNADEVL